MYSRMIVVCICVSVAIAMYVRYRQVAEYLTSSESVHPVRVNKASLAIGLIGAFGMTIVANFQVCFFVNVDCQRPIFGAGLFIMGQLKYQWHKQRGRVSRMGTCPP